ncbi:MAG: hypothetical protein PS018_10455 [bacterium]|nr:hypothetical protein [bacterium]
MRSLLIALVLLSGASLVRAEPPALERGTAITDFATLARLDHDRFALDRMLLPQRSSSLPLATAQLFALASMVPVRQALDREFDRYVARHKAGLPKETIGVGEGFDFQLFDRALLSSSETRFVLAGIVNRMDRAYVAEASCGEVRLIYRLIRIKPPGEATAQPRLPMTLNLVLKAKAGNRPDRDGAEITCADIAGRWLAAADLTSAGAGKNDPLDVLDYRNIDRIETNLQIAHAPKSAVRDFRTDYLLKVFRYDAPAGLFVEAPMENQIDRERIAADDGLKRAFKAWLLDPVHLGEFDRGTALIPEKFLASGAIAPTPVGFDPSNLQPAFGLMGGEGAVFGEADLVTALKKATAAGVRLQNVKSPAGFERRLNDVTCSGCHQTRGIGGFHFPGVDWLAEKPSNSTVVPASPHFFGDQVRRRDILIALRDGKPPDFSRGFASRPKLRGNTELAGTGYLDGWGAHCYAQGKSAGANDKSFADWTCAAGLSCQATGKTSRMGMCFVKSR